MPLQQFLRDLDLLVRSRHSLIVMDTAEEDRAQAHLRELASTMSLPFFTWSLTRGIRREGDAQPGGSGGEAPAEAERDPAVGPGWRPDSTRAMPFEAFRRTDPPRAPAVNGGTRYPTTHPLQALEHVELAGVAAIYHFRALGAQLADPVIATRLGDAAEALAKVGGAIVMTGPGADLPESLRIHGTRVTLPIPRPAEYRRVMRQAIAELSAQRPVRVEMEPDDITRLLNALRGMPLSEARKVITRAVLEDGVLSPDDIPRVLRARCEAVARDGLLEFVPAEERSGAVAGLRELKGWLGKRRLALADPERAAEFGLSFPRGILLTGVPGCGKSLSARMVAAEWGLPLLRLDPAALYDKYLGESERNFRRALEAAERLAPAVLWVDEIEKAFPAQGEQDGGVSTRILGTFLSWMQEREADLFVVATANDVRRLPPELLRKGRFDELFFVDLPADAERRDILRLHLDRRRQRFTEEEREALVAASDGFSGAEIEQAIVSALYTALAANQPLSPAMLLDEMRRTRPLSRTRAEEIQQLRDWARDRAVAA